eukprot:g9522.t1
MFAFLCVSFDVSFNPAVNNYDVAGFLFFPALIDVDLLTVELCSVFVNNLPLLPRGGAQKYGPPPCHDGDIKAPDEAPTRAKSSHEDMVVYHKGKGGPRQKRTFTTILDCFTEDEHHLADSEFCLDQAYAAAKHSPGIMKGPAMVSAAGPPFTKIEDLIIGVNETMLTCKVTGNEKVQKRGCEALTVLSFDLMSMALGYMILCGSDDDRFHENEVQFFGESINCAPFLNVAANHMRSRMERCEERYFLSYEGTRW